jgi:hypothetical protein
MEMMAAIEQGDLALASELQNRIWVDGPFRQPEQVNPLVRQRAAEMNRIALTNGTWVKRSPPRPLDPPAAQRLNDSSGSSWPAPVIEILRAVARQPPSGARMGPGLRAMPNMEKAGNLNAVLDFLLVWHRWIARRIDGAGGPDWLYRKGAT